MKAIIRFCGIFSFGYLLWPILSGGLPALVAMQGGGLGYVESDTALALIGLATMSAAGAGAWRLADDY